MARMKTVAARVPFVGATFRGSFPTPFSLRLEPFRPGHGFISSDPSLDRGRMNSSPLFNPVERPFLAFAHEHGKVTKTPAAREDRTCTATLRHFLVSLTRAVRAPDLFPFFHENGRCYSCDVGPATLFCCVPGANGAGRRRCYRAAGGGRSRR